MRKKFYETPSIEFKLFQSQEDLLTHTYSETGSWGDDWGDSEEGEKFE